MTVPENDVYRGYDNCGTYAGAQRHRKNGEPPCEACRLARNEYANRYRWRNQLAQPKPEYLAMVRSRRVHGSAEMYRKEGCRCDTCRAWNRGYVMGYRHGRQDRDQAGTDDW